MKIESIKIKLKNGKEVELREAILEDAKELCATSKRYYEESDFIPYDKGEFQYTVEEYEKKIEDSINSDNSILIVAIDNHKIIGAIELNGYPNKLMQHATNINVLGMLKEYQGLGVGKALLTTGINWARNHESLELIWLSVFGSHKNGISLYEKIGFKECGRMINFFKKKDGTYDDDITMIRYIKK